MHEEYNTFTEVNDDESSEEWNIVDEDDSSVSEPEYASFACNNYERGTHNYNECLAITQQEVK